jgi:hypothetical protein
VTSAAALLIVTSATLLGMSSGLRAQQASMTFFVTSVGSGKGADLSGLAGADQICQRLAQSVGAGNHTWHAYLSTQAADGQPAVNARDRIGRGPWQNAKGIVIAKDVDELHGNNNLTKQTDLTEKGDIVNGRGDTPNRHDALTARGPTAAPFRPATTKPVTTGRAARKARQSSGTSTARGCATTTRRNHGIPRTPRAAPTAAAARPTCAAPAATDCSTVSPPINKALASKRSHVALLWRHAGLWPPDAVPWRRRWVLSAGEGLAARRRGGSTRPTGRRRPDGCAPVCGNVAQR